MYVLPFWRLSDELQVSGLSKAFDCVLQRFEEDPVEASIMMLHTFNKDREKVKVAVDVISKWDTGLTTQFHI